MDIPAKYDPSATEEKWYSYWMKNEFFRSVPDHREPYCIVIPPPNVTGVLHMGHMLNNTIQDILVRRARMLGKNALWLPGTDHASIATEARVVAKLKENGINKNDLTRDEFLKHAWDWTEKHGGIILEQLKKLGASCDWSRTRFTMDPDLSESVIDVFIDLYKKGLIYRGIRMVNWDPQAKTAVSDEEVIYREVQSKLYYVRYKVENTEDWITIATTRPETILGDTAVCVHPDDGRYKSFHGKKIIVPLVNRAVPLICDTYVDPEFGTGALKITPAHDLNDYELGLRHKLSSINIFADNATLVAYDDSGKHNKYIGTDRFEVRKMIAAELKESGHIVKIDDYLNKVGFSERTDAVIEPRISMQWFLKMKDLAEPALENIMNDTILLHPQKFKNSYRHWMENVKDWCLSRQLWWGHRIPAYHLPDGEIIVAKTREEAEIIAVSQFKLTEPELKQIKQDEDVLDTWFSSWLWPISVFDGIRHPDNPDIKYYYPTDDLVTAPEILFFWVARMIISGYEYRKEKPFKNVYLTGIVRDKQGRKMSKSLGNSPDPIDLMNKYGADGVRVGMLFCSPAGNDLLFDESLSEQGRNFGNKIWNAFRLVKSWQVEDFEQPESSKLGIAWFDSVLKMAVNQVNDHFSKYRLSEALMAVYKLFWDEFSAWYLEIIKPPYQSPIDRKTYLSTIGFFEDLLKLLHPFMPFITEEIWQRTSSRAEGESIMLCKMPVPEKWDAGLVSDFEIIRESIVAVRAIRQEKNIPNKESIGLHFLKSDQPFNHTFDSVFIKMAGLSGITEVTKKPEGVISFMVKTTEYFVELGNIDVSEELKKLGAELAYSKGFLESVNKKLSNERFVSGAPKNVIDLEKNKKSDAEAKIVALEKQILSLKQSLSK